MSAQCPTFSRVLGGFCCAAGRIHRSCCGVTNADKNCSRFPIGLSLLQESHDRRTAHLASRLRDHPLPTFADLRPSYCHARQGGRGKDSSHASAIMISLQKHRLDVLVFGLLILLVTTELPRPRCQGATTAASQCCGSCASTRTAKTTSMLHESYQLAVALSDAAAIDGLFCFLCGQCRSLHYSGAEHDRSRGSSCFCGGC